MKDLEAIGITEAIVMEVEAKQLKEMIDKKREEANNMQNKYIETQLKQAQQAHKASMQFFQALL